MCLRVNVYVCVWCRLVFLQSVRVHYHRPQAGFLMPTGRRPVSFRARSARVHAHRPQAPVARPFFFGREAPVYLPTGRFLFGREATVYLPTGRRPVSFRARSALVPARGFFSGAKRPCTCPPAAGRFLFGCEAPVYLPTGRRPVSFPAPCTCPPASAGASREASVASEAASKMYMMLC